MKKKLFLIIPALSLVFFLTSCSKDDNTTTNNPNPNSTPQGRWVGTGEYGTSGGNPTYVFVIDFKANGTVEITGNNSTAIDVATGTWTMVQNEVRAYYRYANSSANYTLSAQYSANATLLVGTIGLETATSGIGIFSVTRQQ